MTSNVQFWLVPLTFKEACEPGKIDGLQVRKLAREVSADIGGACGYSLDSLSAMTDGESFTIGSTSQ